MLSFCYLAEVSHTVGLEGGREECWSSQYEESSSREVLMQASGKDQGNFKEMKGEGIGERGGLYNFSLCLKLNYLKRFEST